MQKTTHTRLSRENSSQIKTIIHCHDNFIPTTAFTVKYLIVFQEVITLYLYRQ